MTAAPADATSRALDLLAHDLRNATSALWTGIGLLDGSSAEAAAEIGADLRAPAGLVQVVCDLLVEAARASTADPAQAVDLELATLARGAGARTRRLGIEVRVGPAPVDVSIDLARGERLLCAAALELARETIVLELDDRVLVVRGEGAERWIPARVREAAALLRVELAAAAGVAVVQGPASDTLAFGVAGGNR
jgi:hypothetical protein